MGTQKNRLNETVLLSTQNIFSMLKLWVRKYKQFYAEMFISTYGINQFDRYRSKVFNTTIPVHVCDIELKVSDIKNYVEFILKFLSSHNF